MKNIVKWLGIIALIAVIVFAVGCSGSNPKALAKQTYDLQKQALSAGTDLQKAASLAAKSAAITDKVDKLSSDDQQIYTTELARLIAEGK